MATIIDTHTHLYDIPDVPLALREAREAGVTDVVALGVDLISNQKHLALAADSAHPFIHLALGLHPGNITPEEIEKCFPFFQNALKDPGAFPRLVAMGETGLDFWYKNVKNSDEKKNEQRKVFARHLELAREFNLPVVIHSRGAWRECLDMTVNAGVIKANFHWYSGPVDVLGDILDAGFVVSFSPALEYSPESRQAAEFSPLDKILIETDTPVRISVAGGERIPSTPKHVWRTLRALCALKGIGEEQALFTVNQNARAFFGIQG
ncbi:MAG: TatD family hydrolase [Candidatus Omnitrophica bacterium]|nr:TatD family hydrolase [Candidatus Omnitrophota bacterium]